MHLIAKTSRVVLFVIFFMHFNSCEFRRETKSDSDNIKLVEFKNFIGKFKILSAPLEIDVSCYQPDSLSVLLDVDSDSTFTHFEGPSIAIGLLSDTTRYYSVIFGTASACYQPVLLVFSKDSKLLDRQSLSEGCGADEGFFCYERLTIKFGDKFILDKRQEYFKVDEHGNKLGVAISSENIKIMYQIDNNGRIKSTVLSKNQK